MSSLADWLVLVYPLRLRVSVTTGTCALHLHLYYFRIIFKWNTDLKVLLTRHTGLCCSFKMQLQNYRFFWELVSLLIDNSVSRDNVSIPLLPPRIFRDSSSRRVFVVGSSSFDKSSIVFTIQYREVAEELKKEDVAASSVSQKTLHRVPEEEDTV